MPSTPTADEYRAGLLLLQQQQRGQITALIDQVDRVLAQDWQLGMAHAAALYAPLIDAYAKELNAVRIASDDPAATLTLDWLTSRNQQLQRIEASIQASLDRYGATAAQTVISAQQQAVTAGASDAAQLTQRALWPGVEGAGVPPAMLFSRPNPDAIAQWVGRSGNGHPLGNLFANFGPEATQAARKEMLLGLALGANPKAMAKGISNALGISRSRATIISRTEVIGSYRSAAHETYRANADVLNGWMWSAGGANPCFPAGTLIATKRGRIAIEDVLVGDLVLTHRGQFRRVTKVMSRTYRGPMTTLEADDGRRVTATASHPFLAEREGQLDWIEAGQFRLSDGVVSEHEGTTKIIDHRLSDDPVEGRIRQSHNPVALALEIERLAGIAGNGASVPVDAINFEHDVEAGQIEVNRIAPAADRVLLPIADTQSLKTETRAPFWLGLASMATIAAHGAEATVRECARLGADFFAALKTSEGMRGASALLRAIMPIGGTPEQLAAASTGTRREDVGDGSASHAGSGAVNLIGPAQLGAKGLAADGANAVNAMGGGMADGRAVVSPTAAMISPERLAAMAASALNSGVRHLPAHGMGVQPLVLGVAGSGAKAPIAPRIARRRDIEGDAAVLTDAFHIQSITRLAHHIQQTGLLVFNLDVEEHHTYVANGFVVHNCAGCMGMDGLIFALSEELLDHPCGKCSPIPCTKPWDEILSPFGIDGGDMLETSMGEPGAYETGPQKFARMSPQQQRNIIGTNTGYDAYKRGEVELKDFAGQRADGMLYQKSLKEMEIPTGRGALVERAPRLTELERVGNLRYRDFGAPIPVDEMPKWAQQSPASEAVYQILRNGLPWGMRDQEAQILALNLEQMLREELPLNVRLASLRQLDFSQQYERYLNIYQRNITGGASTLPREAPPFVYAPSKELERALAAARRGEHVTALESGRAYAPRRAAQEVPVPLERQAITGDMLRTEAERIRGIVNPGFEESGVPIEQIATAFDAHNAAKAAMLAGDADWQRMVAEMELKPYKDVFNGEIVTPEMQLVSRLEGSWTALVMDEAPVNVALRQAAQEVFGLNLPPRAIDPEIRAQAEKFLADYRGALHAYVKATYDQTQQWFAERGITEITLYRGSSNAAAKEFLAYDGKAATRQVEGAAFSSYSADPAFAYGFSTSANYNAGEYQALIAVRAPVSEVFGTPFTSMAKQGESEFLLFGRPQEAAILSWKGADAAPALNKALDELAPKLLAQTIEKTSATRATVSDAEAAARLEVRTSRTALNGLNRKLERALASGKNTEQLTADIAKARETLASAQAKLDAHVATRKAAEAEAKAATKAQVAAEKAAAREAAKAAKLVGRQAAKDATVSLPATGKLPPQIRAALKAAVERGELPASYAKYTTVEQLAKTVKGSQWLEANVTQTIRTGEDIAFATSRATTGYYSAEGNYELSQADKQFVADLKQQADRLNQSALTHDQAISIGAQLHERIYSEGALNDYHDYAAEAKEIRRIAPEMTDAQRAWAMGNPDAVAEHGGVRWTEAEARYHAEFQARAQAYLTEMREMGGADIKLNEAADGFDARLAGDIRAVQDLLPREWVEASNNLGELNVIKQRATNSAGWYKGDYKGSGTVSLGYNKKTAIDDIGLRSSALHEMMHRMEDAIPRIGQLEKEFYDYRTAGEGFVRLTNGIGQNTKLDRWADEYLGREPIVSLHEGGYQLPDGRMVWALNTSSYELLSMGAELLMGGGGTLDLVALREDEEYVQFVLGLLATVRAEAPGLLPDVLPEVLRS